VEFSPAYRMRIPETISLLLTPGEFNRNRGLFRACVDPNDLSKPESGTRRPAYSMPYLVIFVLNFSAPAFNCYLVKSNSKFACSRFLEELFRAIMRKIVVTASFQRFHSNKLSTLRSILNSKRHTGQNRLSRRVVSHVTPSPLTKKD